MTRLKSNTVSETGVAFFSAGGHSHDGINSSIIDTTKYSIFDFNFGLISTNSARVNYQGRNEQAFKDFIIRTINQSVLEPAGVVLQDNIINSRNIISGSITSEEIAANTITANNIAAGTITGDLIAANTIAGNSILAGSITATQIAANTLQTDNLILTNGDFWTSNGSFRLGGATGITYSGSGTVNFGSGITITGSITSTGTISGGTISGGTVSGGFVSGASITGGSISIGGAFFVDTSGIATAAQFSTGSSGARIEMGPNYGHGDELRLVSSGGGVGSIRNTSGTSLRLSATTVMDIDSAGVRIPTASASFAVTGAGSSLLIIPSTYFRSQLVYDTTISSAANMHIGANYTIYRSTSSIKYKTDVEDLWDSYAKKILQFRPVWFRSLCNDDLPNHSHFGLIAEEVAEIEPRLVHWGIDDLGNAVPEGVQYDRIIPHLIYLIKDLYKKNETLEKIIQEM